MPASELPTTRAAAPADDPPRPDRTRVTDHGVHSIAWIMIGVTQVVVAGVATSIGVESTARHAHEHGLHVTLATDAMTDLNPAAHDHTIAHIFPKLGETGTTADLLADPRVPGRLLKMSGQRQGVPGQGPVNERRSSRRETPRVRSG
jgi:hypothetical protein